MGKNQSTADKPLIAFGIPIFIMALGIFLIVNTDVEGKMQFIPVIFILLGVAELIRSIARQRNQLTKKQQVEINQKSGHYTYLFIVSATLVSVIMLVMDILSIEMVLHIHLTFVILVYPILQIMFLIREV